MEDLNIWLQETSKQSKKNEKQNSKNKNKKPILQTPLVKQNFKSNDLNVNK